MISNIIANELGSSVAELIFKTNLFVEFGTETKQVLVKTIEVTNPEQTIIDFEKAKMEIFVEGWDKQAGYDLSNEIAGFIKPMTGLYTYNSKSYTIKSVVMDKLPVPTYHDDTDAFLGFSTKFNLFYQI
ncbi:MAG: hypothetical protein GY760_00870 [Deltaproteobacteria bacterium]|nr:hypothetical protein [Deltaproteobacteria bacterium]